MPSPFPGMDPFIQGQIWLNFHNSFCIALRNQLVPQVSPKYGLDVEERLVVEVADDSPASYLADVSLKEGDSEPRDPVSASVATAMLEPAREVILRILDRRSRRIVTVVELFSPWNKSPSGLAEYLVKREDLLHADVNLVELDLVRGGRRLPTVERMPRADFVAFVTRVDDKKRLLTYPWNLVDSLPTLPVPLADGDQAEIRLQEAFTRVNDEGGYRHLLTYRDRPKPSLPKSFRDWALERLRSAGIEPPEEW